MGHANFLVTRGDGEVDMAKNLLLIQHLHVYTYISLLPFPVFLRFDVSLRTLGSQTMLQAAKPINISQDSPGRFFTFFIRTHKEVILLNQKLVFFITKSAKLKPGLLEELQFCTTPVLLYFCMKANDTQIIQPRNR